MNNEKTLRETALNWWNFDVLPFNTSKKEYPENRVELTAKYYPDRFPTSLTGREIEHIYISEHPETIKQQSNSVVSIEDAAVNYAERQTKHFLPANDKVAFKEGAKFRDEQYSSLLSSYRELLDAAFNIHNHNLSNSIHDDYSNDGDGHFDIWQSSELSSKFEDLKEQIEKANNILKQFNP